MIGAPALINYGGEKIQKEILPALFAGEKFISLAISEAGAGSDVRGMTTRATKTADGRFFEVTGAKKWITVRLTAHSSSHFLG